MYCCFLLLVLSIVLPFYIFYRGEKTVANFKRNLALNIISFFGIIFVSTFLLFKNVSAAETTQVVDSFSRGMGFFAAALVTGLSTIGAGIATGSAASSA